MYPNMRECAERIEKSGIALKCSNNPHVPLHTHKWFEIAYVVKGKTEYRAKQNSFIIQEGNYFVIDYDCPHEYYRINDEPFQMINIMFTPRFMDQRFMNLKKFDDFLINYPIRIQKTDFKLRCENTLFNDNDSIILGYINQMQGEYSAQKLGHLESMRCILMMIMIQIMRNICVSEKNHNADNRSYVIAEYIRMHYAEKIRIEDAFPENNYSLSYMSRRFREDMGMTFSNYLKKVRIEESCRLLLNSDKTIMEIAELVGCPDTTSYHRAFKELMHMSPNEYKKIYQKAPIPAADEMVQERIGS